MYVILTYDINKKRVSKVLKICRRYLQRIQNSVFEGHLTDAQLASLKRELEQKLIPSEDGVQIYCLESTRYVHKEQLGKTQMDTNILE